jgi:hypothetical protein
MVQTYQDLHELVSSVVDRFLATDAEATIAFEIEENGLCSMTNKRNGNKFKFMFARFGDEYKVGFAFFEAYQPQPVWIDDVLNTNFDVGFVNTLITEHLIE